MIKSILTQKIHFMRWINRTLTILACLLLPTRIKPAALRLMGHRINSTAKIGFALLDIGCIRIAGDAHVKSLSFYRCRRLVMRAGSHIGRYNYFDGPFCIALAENSKIGNRNVFKRSSLWRNMPAYFKLGHRSSLTSGHYMNLDAHVSIGAESVIGGVGSQFWTHGFVHMSDRKTRSLVVGPISIGDNVYIGSHSTINPGTRIDSDISIGTNACISGHLADAGFYVSQPLRFIQCTAEARVAALPRLTEELPGHPTFWKEA